MPPLGPTEEHQVHVGPPNDTTTGAPGRSRSPFVADGQVVKIGSHRFIVSVPAGLALTDLAAQRLARRLHDAHEAVDTLVAPVATLPAGSSARTDAERRSARPDRPIEMPAPSATEGCSVRRLDLSADSELTRTGTDPDVVCQDLNARFTAPRPDATPAGRPVFPRGAVALLLVGGNDPATAELGRRWANDLTQRGIDARLAVADPADGSHLTSPCRPSAATVAALRLDVIVALDHAAQQAAVRWTANHQLTEIHVDAAAGTRCETVSWRIGVAQGNLRYRVGPDIDLADLAAAIDRCCGLPPARTRTQLEAARPGRQSQGVSVLVSRRRSTARPTVTSVELIGRPRDPGEAAWWDGLVDQFLALGCTVDIAPDVASATNAAPDLRLLGGPAAATVLASAGRESRGAGLSALLLSHVDLDRAGPDDAAGDLALHHAAQRAASAAEAVLTSSPAVERVLRQRDLPVRRLPPFLGREPLRDLRAAATAARAGRLPLVGWHLAGPTRSPLTSVVGTGLGQVLTRHPELLVDLTVDCTDPGPAPVAASRRRPAGSNGHARDIADCRVQIWTPAVRHLDATGDPGRAVEAMLAAVPVVAAPADRAALGRLGRAAVTPTDPDDAASWAEAIERALRGDGPATDRTQIQARMLHGDQAAAVRGHRVLGWLLRRADR